MSVHYTEDDVISAVARLTRKQLTTFVAARIVIPLQSQSGPVFRHMDIARIELLCELCEQYELQEDALGMVMSLVDQLHGVRAELRAVLNAVEDEQADVRNRIANKLFQARQER